MEEHSTKYTNKLIDQTSPYLLQHAHNPVDWYPWGKEALERAKEEDKPILVSIGYAACHWCHVMERESFEDTAVAALMNENFICIKVDREERPDIDDIYMEAVQIMAGSGGWPLNVFLTPDAKPFYGGTYFPPKSSLNRPSWSQVLKDVSKAFKEKRADIETQAEKLTAYIKGTNNAFYTDQSGIVGQRDVFKKEDLDAIFESLQKHFDKQDGGIGRAPKFPSTMSIGFLLRYYHFTANQQALDHALLSLDKMIMGGIYDQLGGGFARYSTDNKWLVPHFEKMLYDNALLVSVIADAYMITKKELYKQTIEQTLAFIEREMTNKEGGFYSSYDADSEGEEGKYYVWDKKEIESILGEEADLFNDFYNVSALGNWEGENILHYEQSYQGYAEKNNIKVAALKARLTKSSKKLFEQREKRVKPGLDDKVLLNWNSLMCSAYAKAYRALHNERYRQQAEKNITFMLEKFKIKNTENEYYHTYSARGGSASGGKDGKAKYIAFLDDYAYLIGALIDVYEINFDEQLLLKANNLMHYVLDNFQDEQDNMFYYTSSKQKDIILRKKEFYDGAIPSGNSTMAYNLQRAGLLFEEKKFTEMAISMLLQLKSTILKSPTSFSRWANTMTNFIYPIHEIAVVGPGHAALIKDINEMYIPNRILMVSNGKNDSDFPLLKGKNVSKETLIYVCRNYICKLPVKNIESFRQQIKN